jgi:hypothetical protein
VPKFLGQGPQDHPASRRPGAVGAAEQAQSQDEVDHCAGRQEPAVSLGPPGQLQHRDDHFGGDLLGEHAEPDPGPDAAPRRPDRSSGRREYRLAATILQTCVVHLLRNSFRYVARQDWEKIAKALRPVCTAPTEEAALERFVEFTDAWGGKYPAIVRLWEAAWAEFAPFLQFDVEIRKIVCTTNASESVNARIRKAARARGHFPTDQAALTCVYLAAMRLDPTGTGRKRWTMRWKDAVQAFDITFDGRLTAVRR